MDDAELREIKRAARRNRMTVAEWVRQALRAARHDYPTGDIEGMLGDIERGYAQDAQ